MTTRHEFETSIEWKGAKDGALCAPELPGLQVASPPVFGGSKGKWTPEHLFVASAEVCVMMTFLAMAEFSKLSIRGYRSEAKGTLEKVEGEGLQFTSIEVSARVELEHATDAVRAERILGKAEANCLVSKSMKTPVRVSAKFESMTHV